MTYSLDFLYTIANRSPEMESTIKDKCNGTGNQRLMGSGFLFHY